ncbi:MAG: biopolymer transporter ExbD [Candidatus Omnitrophica bacterium]|nr:biopolymer transporter ExbD [Candidatus Omnitrophota bacterium]MBD3269287.1 biopolymer transporter ExbD [Candidatus Omnitrophota bacterium]
MRFKKSARVEVGLHQIDIAPLIDCVFLLIIFFMLTSSFVVVPGINVKLPKAITSESIDTRTLTIVISSEDIIYVDDSPYTVNEVENHIKKREGLDSVFIKADRDASLGVAVRIWDLCKRHGIEKVGIATTYED